jgi:hypothetical protein
MSFRLFIYYSALAGAASALAGWAIGRRLASGGDLIDQGTKGLVLAATVALALAVVDGLWNGGLARPFSLLARVFCAVSVGATAGLLGGLVSEMLYRRANWDLFVVVGYVVVGLLVGASLGLFDLLAALFANRSARGAVRKIRSGLIGGGLGGLVGGLLSWFLGSAWGQLFADRDRTDLWSPSAAAYAALGFFLGLLIGLAQVILKRAWLRVENGFRAGRELILTREEITIGRAESCDVGLFGDSGVEKLHARIRRGADDYVLSDAGTPGGTYLNGERISGPRPLASGDEIRVGRCVLRFEERTKR